MAKKSEQEDAFEVVTVATETAQTVKDKESDNVLDDATWKAMVLNKLHRIEQSVA